MAAELKEDGTLAISGTPTKDITIDLSAYVEKKPEHTYKLTNIPAKAAAGNIEYWSCACGKYFSDKEGAREIRLSDTAIAKISPAIDTPKTSYTTGERIWYAVVFAISAGGLAVLALTRKQKKLQK